jgi:hypothetical protein
MALIRQFYRSNRGAGDNESIALARDVLTDEVFILHRKTYHDGLEIKQSETRTSVAEFLNGSGSAQSELLELIGTLVIEE